MPPQTQTVSMRDTSEVVLKTEFFVKRFLEPFRKELITMQLANRETLPRGEGKVSKFVLPDATPTGTSDAGQTGDPDTAYVLSEGTDPIDSLAFAFNTVSITIQQRGAFFEVADLVDKVAIDGTVTSYVDAASYHARLVMDDRLLSELSAFAGATQNAGSAITAEELRKGAIAMRSPQASPEEGGVPHHPATPGGQFYCFLSSVEAGYDLVGEGAPAWFQAKQTAELQANLTSPLNGTPASSAIYDVIVKTSDNIKRDAGTSPDDDINFMLGKDAFGVSELSPSGANAEIIIKPSSQGGLASPLNMRGIIGWKAEWAAEGLKARSVRKVLSDATGIG